MVESDPPRDSRIEPSIESLVTALRRQMSDAFPSYRIPGREQLGTDPMDPLVGRYLEEELDRRVDQELARISYEPSEWVSGQRRDTVDRAHRTLRSTVAEAVSFPASLWEEMLDEACVVGCRFVASPIAALISEVFQLRADQVSVAVARSRIRALAGHPAITDAVDDWLASTDDPVSRRTFTATVRQIVDELMDHEDAWITSAEPLFALHERVNGKRSVPTSRLQMLYRDLDLGEIAETIGEQAATSGSNSWTDAALVRALSSRQDEPFEPEPPEPESTWELQVTPDSDATFESETTYQLDTSWSPPVVPEASPPIAREVEQTLFAQHHEAPDVFLEDIESVNEVVETHPAGEARPQRSPVEIGVDKPDRTSVPAESPVADKAVPLWMRFQSRINAPMKAEAARPGPVATPVRTYPQVSSPRTDAVEEAVRPLWERYRRPQSRDVANTLSRPDFGEVEAYVLGDIDEARREDYVATLFGGRMSAYRESIYALSEVGSWPVATSFIAEEVFRRNRVNIYHEVAIDFTNAVERRYKR